VTNSSYVFGGDKRLPRVELRMNSKQLQQCRQVLTRLYVDLRLKQVRYAVTLQAETKPNWTGYLLSFQHNRWQLYTVRN